jgi:hypothetical protein
MLGCAVERIVMRGRTEWDQKPGRERHAYRAITLPAERQFLLSKSIAQTVGAVLGPHRRPPIGQEKKVETQPLLAVTLPTSPLA